MQPQEAIEGFLFCYPNFDERMYDNASYPVIKNHQIPKSANVTLGAHNIRNTLNLNNYHTHIQTTLKEKLK